jgi:hypothetical protein
MKTQLSLQPVLGDHLLHWFSFSDALRIHYNIPRCYCNIPQVYKGKRAIQENPNKYQALKTGETIWRIINSQRPFIFISK